MVKHTQTTYQLLPANCLSVFDNIVGLELKGLFPIKILPIEIPCLRHGIHKKIFTMQISVIMEAMNN